MNFSISIDNLIEVVKTGGKVKTGVDVYNRQGVLLLDKDILVDKVKILEVIKDNGINTVHINNALDGGFWDGNGNQISLDGNGVVEVSPARQKKEPEPELLSIPEPPEESIFPDSPTNEIEKRLKEIGEIQKEAAEKYNDAKGSIKKVLSDIKETGGEFDFDEVENNVSELVEFLVVADNPFSYLTQEILSYDDYLYNHSINVCAIGTAVINRFNTHFSNFIDDLIKGEVREDQSLEEEELKKQNNSYICYYPEELEDISLGFFLHDIGKVLVDDRILNKEGKLTPKEFEEVKKHSFEYGMQLMDHNNLKNSVVRNIIKYHHAPLYEAEERCYPVDKKFNSVPLYVRVCKLADIYDAMTSKRSYKEAFNPIMVVTKLFRSYAKKDIMLQHILRAFVKSIGIYPPGSIVFLQNGQMAYVLESQGPIVIPFTDEQQNTLRKKPDPIDLSASGEGQANTVDNSRSVKEPKDVYATLPDYIRKIAVRS